MLRNAVLSVCLRVQPSQLAQIRQPLWVSAVNSLRLPLCDVALTISARGMRANTHKTLIVDNTALQMRYTTQPFLTHQHRICVGKAEVVRTQQSDGWWVSAFSMCISEERKYVRKTLKTTHLETAIERAENELFAIKANVNAGRRVFSRTVPCNKQKLST